MKLHLLGLVGLIGLSACAQLESAVNIGTQKGAVALANGVAAECQRALENRKQAYKIYSIEELKVRPGKSTALLPLDCNGDGASDF